MDIVYFFFYQYYNVIVKSNNIYSKKNNIQKISFLGSQLKFLEQYQIVSKIHIIYYNTCVVLALSIFNCFQTFL